MKDKGNMKNKRNRVFFITVIFCMVLALQAFASETPVTKIGIKRIEATDTANGYLEVGPASGTQPGQFFSYPHGEQFLPGDTAEGILCLQLPAELEPVTFTLKAANSNKDEGIFGAAVLQVIEGGETVYEKTLPEFAYSLSCGRTGTEPAEKNIYLKLVFPKNGDQTELQKLKAQQLKFELELTADLMDYAVKRYVPDTDNRIEVYQAFYNNRYYYTESGTPSTEEYYAEGTLTAAQEKEYLSDYQVIPGKTLDSAESYYIDHKDGNRRVFIGASDLHFGTADDAKALTDSRGEENGTNVRRGDPALPAEKQFDGLHYTNGADGIPGTADDKRIYAGSSGYGSADDYYIDDEDGDLFVYAGTDLKFGTEDDVKALEKSAGVKNGTGVLRGDPAFEAGLQFGGENHAGGTHYYVGGDGIPGTADDKELHAGTNGFGSADDFYIDDEDGNLKVYSGYDPVSGAQDLIFGNANDAKELMTAGKKKNGTCVLRGDPAQEAGLQFGGTGHAGGDHYYTGHDGIPGTKDDKKISAGADGKYFTKDDCYTDEDGLEVYSGFVTADGKTESRKQDLIFGNENDIKALTAKGGGKNGTGVLRGTAAEEAEQFGGKNHAGGDHYYVGNDRIPGTADDKLIRPGYDGTYGKAGNYYLDDEDGDREVYIGKDLCFGTADDAKALVKETGDKNGTNVLRGSETAVSEQFGGTGHAGGKHLTSGRDGIPGNSDDKTVSAGTDKTYGTADDFYLEGKKEVYSAEDLIFGTADDAMKLDSGSNVRRGSAPEPSEQFGGSDRTGGSHYTNGPDTVPGTADDKLIYRTPEKEYAYYIDGADGRSVYIGEDKTFGTADDAKLLDNGTNVRRGSSETAAEQFGGTGYLEGAHYWNGADGIPATADDRVLNRGTDGAFFTSDDHYADGADGLLVYAAEDECFGTEDDAKALKDSQGNLTGANVRRGTETAAAKQFGGTDHAGGDHYYSGNDLIPGTADDKKIFAGTDGKFGTADDHYTDDEDGNLDVFIGPDLHFGTADDAKALADRNGKDGTNVLRGTGTEVSKQFGGADHTGAAHYYNGNDGIPGTSDDKEVLTGTDRVYGSSDDYYADDEDGDLRVFIGQDLHFGTEDDAKEILNGQGEETGTNVRRGTSAAAAEQFGGAGHAGGDHYYRGVNGIHGTADDRPVNAGTDGVFGTKDDSYTEERENLPVFCGKDLKFGTEDDAMGYPNASNVPRGASAQAGEQFGRKGRAGEDYFRYTNGEDGIPGADPDGKTKAEDEDQKIYPGEDKKYGTSDDYYIFDEKANMRAGQDLIWGTADDELWDTGSDNKHGSWDDRKLGYPRDTSQKDTKSSWSGGGAVSGSFDSSVSPVGFAKAVEGTWSKDAFGRWTFVSEDGVQAKSKWVNIYNKSLGTSDWFYFDANGIMQTGWQKTGNGKWYCLRTAEDARYGAMEKGLYQDSSDGNFYYLDPVTGIMQTGWQKINGKYYYFAEESAGTSWFWNSQIGRWASRMLGGHPYGAMYRNEKTPDGHQVDATGARID